MRFKDLEFETLVKRAKDADVGMSEPHGSGKEVRKWLRKWGIQ